MLVYTPPMNRLCGLVGEMCNKETGTAIELNLSNSRQSTMQ